jgi:glycosyltransferase involved in cell wall biosynthesis
MHTDPNRYAIVIPLYNHRDRVEGVVTGAAALGWPVFVVDDGSTDGSAERVPQKPNVRLLRHPENRGKGAALLAGFAAAVEVANWAVTIDADGQHDPADIPPLIRAIPPDDRYIMVGHRQGMTGEVGVPWTSRFGRGFSNFWVRCSGGPKMADSQSGFRVYPIPEVLNLNVKARRFQFEVEVLARAGWRGIPVVETPVSVNYHGGVDRISHFRPFVDFVRNSRAFSRLIVQRIFIPAGIRKRWCSGHGLPPVNRRDR